MSKIIEYAKKLSLVAAVPALVLVLAAVAEAQTYDSYGGGYGNQNSNDNSSMGSGTGSGSSYDNPYNSNSNANLYGPRNMNAPNLNVYSTDSSSVNLQVGYPQGAGMSASVQVYVWNQDTGNTATRTYAAMFDSQGMANVNVSNLHSGTNYAFFVKVSPSGSNNYSPPSSPVGAKTM